MANTTGVENFINQYSVGDLSVNNAPEMNINLKSVNEQDTLIAFDTNNAYTTTDDVVNLTLENVTNDSNIQLDGNDIETLNIESITYGNKVDLGGSALDNTKTVVITGDKDLSIDTAIDASSSNAMTSIETVDASLFTGNLDLDFNVLGNPTQADTKLNITGGIGDDRVIMTLDQMIR